MTCPCGIGDSLATCCGPIISGAKPAPTAEALMRARYTAYTQQSIDFILESVHPESKGDMDRRSTEAWSRYAQWHGLEILNKSRGGEGDEEGEVEFVAKFSIKGTPQRHHERAQFKRHAGKWLYFDGDEIRPQPVSGPRVKPSRNDDCPCGSGRKFKKCCGPVWESGATTPEQLVRARFSAAVTGEAAYLVRSLHPDAKELTTEQPTGTLTELKVGKVSPEDDDARVESSYTETTNAVSSKKRAITRCRRLGDRWLLLSASLD